MPRKSSRNTGRTSTASETSESAESTTLSRSISYVADSRARTSAVAESVSESTEKEADCGVSTSALFAIFDRDSSSWRTSQRCFLTASDEFSETWPLTGMTRNGDAFALTESVLPRNESGSSSWPTLKKSDHAQFTRNRKYFERRVDIAPDLPVIVALRTPPTPNGFYGRLNPAWCEWLMGFPTGWTELDVSETQLSRK